MNRSLLLLLVFILALHACASDTQTFYVESASMNKSIPNLVILPDAYHKQARSFPVLYLLHGAGGDHRDWLAKVPRLEEYADRYDFIIVCPDGGYTSWYFDSPVDDNMRYETYIAGELVAAIDREYHTIAKRSGRAISGLSMGGHGAFYLAFRNQDIWGAAGSTSGGMDIRPFPDRWDLSKRLGPFEGSRENWDNNTVINMVHLLEGDNLKLIFDCGVDDFFYDVNKKMHEKLLRACIPHDYTERPGEHNRAYWANSIRYQLLFFRDFFESAEN